MKTELQQLKENQKIEFLKLKMTLKTDEIYKNSKEKVDKNHVSIVEKAKRKLDLTVHIANEK